MANLKEIRNRINSISSTMQITSAMKMVSAAKSKKAQEAIHAMKPYANTLGNLLKSLKSALGTTNPFLPREKGEKRILVVAITSDRGLCGAFNSTVVKHTLSLLEKYEGKEVEILTIGKKGNDILKKTGKVSRYCEGFFDRMDFQKVAEMFSASFPDGSVMMAATRGGNSYFANMGRVLLLKDSQSKEGWRIAK